MTATAPPAPAREDDRELRTILLAARDTRLLQV